MWVDVLGGVKQVYTIEGPEPFGGLGCADEGQAAEVAERLNQLHGRRAPDDEPPAPPDPHPVANALTRAFRDLGPET
jgi:hypothetical protein